MSTRSIIVVTGEDKYQISRTTRLYKHSDGYPNGVLPIILEALTKALEQGKAHAKVFRDPKPKPIGVSQVIGHLIGAATTEYGMGARLDFDSEPSKSAEYAEYVGAFKPEHLGQQWDLEWIYLIDLKDRSLKIYGGEYTGEPPQAALAHGMVSPEAHARLLKEHYRHAHITKTREYLRGIELLGFKINPSEDS